MLTMHARLPLLFLVVFSAGCSASSGSSNGNGDGDSGDSNTNGDGSAMTPGDGDNDSDIDVDQIVDREPEEIPDCDNILDAIVRDFNKDHPDFGGIPYSNGQEGLFIGDQVRRQLVMDDLGADKKPVFRDAMGCAAPDLSNAVGDCADWGTIPEALTTEANFREWYLETPGKNHVFDKEIELTDQGDGTYVFDTDAFFPLGTDEGFGETTGDSSENVDAGRNFLFTTEIHLQFTYVPGQQFTFRGDDDLWVFVNGKLALDLGSMHLPAAATIDFDAQAAALGISPNGSYSMDIFHAERRWNGSNFRIETNISCFIPVTEGIVR